MYFEYTRMGYLRYLIIAAFIKSCMGDTDQEAQKLSVYGPVPGLSPSPYYSFKVREYGSEEWLDTFALVTECTGEKFCNTTNAFDAMEGWSNTYINFEMKDGVEIEIRITKLSDGHKDDIEKAVVHPEKAAEDCFIENGRAHVLIQNTGLFTVDIDGQMDDQGGNAK